MRPILIVFVCLMFALSAFAQNDAKESRTVAVEEITLGKDDGSGVMGDEQDEFLPTDVPLHCSVLLTSEGISTIRMDIVLLKAGSTTSGTKIVTVNFKNTGGHSLINFTGKPEKNWKIGDYKVDIFINEKLSKSRNFTVRSAAAGAKIEPK